VSDDERITFTDEEVAFLRHVRFGELPPRVLPDDRIESVESEARPSDPEPGLIPWLGRTGYY
jgi:hypothetical protein